MTFVGIRVYNPKRSDTRLPRSPDTRRLRGFDCYVEDLYVVSPEEICERLRNGTGACTGPRAACRIFPVSDAPIPL
jgi:hypothetical protein